MPIVRRFLDWREPCLTQAAAFLLDEAAGPDLSGLLVVTPGGRASRRLLEILIEKTAGAASPLVPPRFTTPGSLAEVLLRTPPDGRRVADPLHRRVAWIAALRQADPAAVLQFLPHPPAADDTLGWASIAEVLDTLHAELAGFDLDFAAVGERGEELPDFNESDRWAALAAVQQSYHRTLAGADLIDPQQARAETLASPQWLDTERRIVLVAIADLNGVQRRLLDLAADRVTALVHAPADRAAGFDERGCLVTDHWCDAPIDIPEGCVRLADRPADQADAALRAIAALEGRFAADQVTIGLCDPQVAPYLQQLLPSFGVPVRDPAGVPLTGARPATLLAAAAAWLERMRFADFATLLRHPDVESALPDRAGGENWLTLLDRYYTDHLQARASGAWLGDEKKRRRLAAIYHAVESLVGPLKSQAPRPLSAWAQPIADVILNIYGRTPLNRQIPADRLLLESCDALAALLRELHALPAPLAPAVTASQAIRLLLMLAGAASPIAPEADDAAVELLGTLELHLDDAPALVVTGFNEGLWPSSVSADAFLPDAMRRTLGVTDNRRRYARDAYTLAAVLASRPHVTLIAGRRSVEGDPLSPSRFLFAADDATILRRAQRFYVEPPAASAPLAPAWAVSAASRFVVPPPPLPLTQPVRSLSVTAFRSYLACPYRFYLGNVMGLRHVDDAAQEMEGGAFGDLAHAVLHEFGNTDSIRSTDPRKIAAVLDDLLDAAAARAFGSGPLPAVRVQVQQLRMRLAAFAEWQARWAAEGWTIHDRELEFTIENGVTLDGAALPITGRIDRIDFNERTGAWAILDYKTSDAAKTPDETHRRDEQWIDLQLPLYRHLAAKLNVTGDVRLGYVLLPRDPAKVGEAMATWSEEELWEADDVARRVIAAVVEEEFYPPTGDPPEYDDFAEICGVDQIVAALRADVAAGEGEG